MRKRKIINKKRSIRKVYLRPIEWIKKIGVVIALLLLLPSSSASTGKVIKEVVIYRSVELSAFSSTPDQTDDTPFITANGTYVRDGIVAANFLPFHTKIRIPEFYGDKIFTVEDRMHPRYPNGVDIWFPDRDQAKKFARKYSVIEIITLSADRKENVAGPSSKLSLDPKNKVTEIHLD